VNAPPHVGFALEIVQADAFARALRWFGHDVHASTGTDDHSLKNLRAAEAAGEPVSELIDRNAARFAELSRVLGARFDDSVRTSRDRRHCPSVERLFRALAVSGDLYRRRYSGAYCVGCESFLDPAELVDGLCSEHGRPPEPVEEENWFFRLSRYAEPLLEAITSGRLRILPEERKNEVVGFIRGGLHDFSVSRSVARARGFGVAVPDDPEQVTYVWVDALANYLTTFDYGTNHVCGWHTASSRIHLLGKGVLRFHAVYWPALLLSAGLPLPDELRVHGYLTVDGRKIGKSLGNGLDPIALANERGSTALRYYLLRHVPSFKDADFSRERLIAHHDAEIADELGNLARRTLTLVARYAGSRVPEPGALRSEEQELEALAASLPARVREAVHEHELGRAIDVVWELVRAGNRYLDVTEPWRLARVASTSRTDDERLRTVLATTLGALRVVGVGLAPFVPELASALTRAVGGADAPNTAGNGGSRESGELSIFRELPVGRVLDEPAILAPRLRPRGAEG
jgi:methionyl-tRNA synthetase